MPPGRVVNWSLPASLLHNMTKYVDKQLTNTTNNKILTKQNQWENGWEQNDKMPAIVLWKFGIWVSFGSKF